MHVHAVSQRRHQDDGRNPATLKKPQQMSKTMLLALVESLTNAIKKCALPKMDTEWGDYYDDTNYSTEGMSAKEKAIKSFVDKYVGASETIHDIGANTGRFSHLVANPERYVLSHDIDELAVERHYLSNRRGSVGNVLPLVLNLNNPTPAIGWALNERESLVERIQSDVVMALALIHHLAIANNIPLDSIAGFFHKIAKKLIIEFVPKEDSQVQRLLATRDDVFPDYNIECFEQTLSGRFNILTKTKIDGTERTLYMLERN
jgi:ribosomal protein L11 methylase PrmA